MSAIDQARDLYESNGKDFDEVLITHLETGIVLSSPAWFMMIRLEKWADKHVGFVECAVGSLSQLAALVSIPIPFIAFCRMKNGQKQTKIYKTERLLRLAALA